MLHQLIQEELQRVVHEVLPAADLSTVLVRPCPDARFGDYQSNSLMTLAKARKMNPRQLATDIVARLKVSDWCEPVEVAGAGFLNFRVKPSALTAALTKALSTGPLFHTQTTKPRTIVVDFSSPNVAKSMHVGHIRSTILGDSLSRVLRLLGHRVITDNHLGDWGTQFGMLLLGWKTMLDPAALKANPLAELERIYKAVNAQVDPEKPGFNQNVLDQVRAELVKLQSGDEENLGIWREMFRLSEEQFKILYKRLGVTFDYTYGESFYNPQLKSTVEDLVARGVAVESRGAKAILSDGSLPPKEDPFLIHREEQWTANPFIVQKNDGGFNYATTDLATLAFRTSTWKADEVVYVTDGRQQLHFRQLFASFGRWKPEVKVRLEHVWFGSILGEDGRPLKTRSGANVPLSELLNEAEERAFQLVTSKSPDLPEAERREIARVIGIGAVKYADLLPNRQTDYVFSWDKMLALNGNTAPYLQYAYTRVRSIFRKAGEQGQTASETVEVSAPEEVALAKQMLNFGLVLEAVAEEFRPNFLCNYLYDLAGKFTTFYEKCPVLKAEPTVRANRLALCDLTSRVLKQGLQVLGIEVLESM